MSEAKHTTDDVFGVSRDLPLNYISRKLVDEKLVENLTRNHHIVIYGSSKQGKTSLRKHCLNIEDYIVVSCQNKWSLRELHSAILKEAGYTVKASEAKTVSGHAKVTASTSGKTGIPLVAEGKADLAVEGEGSITKTTSSLSLELDPEDVNDIVRALNTIDFRKYVILEDFHYLPDETQRDFSFALKAFHENSKICFIIIGVWREQNRLIAYNGDLTDRVFSVDVDTWDYNSLAEVIKMGEELLYINFSVQFKEELLKNCFDSVHIVQETCRRCCRNKCVYNTCEELTEIDPNVQAKSLIREVVEDQSGRYRAFLMNFSDGFQQTDLEIPKWIIFGILSLDRERLANGIRLRELSRRIKTSHPKGESLNNGNITQTLNSASSLQQKKGIRPIVIDYDSANRNLHIVDKGFLIWLSNQDISELLDELGLPEFSDNDLFDAAYGSCQQME